MSYTREPLSSSTHGRFIKVAATGTPGTTFHTGQASTTLVDVVAVEVANTDTVGRRLTIEWGGTTSPDDTQQYDVPPKWAGWIVTDRVIRNSLVCKAFCDAANVVCIGGFGNIE